MPPPESEAVSLGLLQNANVRLLRLDTGLQHAVPTAAVVLRLLDIIINHYHHYHHHHHYHNHHLLLLHDVSHWGDVVH